jgi:hypothetical protein
VKQIKIVKNSLCVLGLANKKPKLSKAKLKEIKKQKILKGFENNSETSCGWAVPSSGQAGTSLSWDRHALNRTLRLSSMYNKIYIIFHLPKKWVRLAFAYKIEVVFQLTEKLKSSSICVKNWGRLPFAYKVELVFEFSSYLTPVS